MIADKYRYTSPIKMQRSTHYGSNYYIIPSRKLRRNVSAFSYLEYCNILTLEMDSNIEFADRRRGWSHCLRKRWLNDYGEVMVNMQEITDSEVITNKLTMSRLRSDEFIIYTKEIGILEAKILEIVMLGNCGACVVSRPRCGKTTAMIYISKSLKTSLWHVYLHRQSTAYWCQCR